MARPRTHPPLAAGAGPSVGVGGGVSGWCWASLPVVQVNDGVDVGVSAGVSGRRGWSHRSRSDGRLFQRRTAPSLPGTIFQFTFLLVTCGGFSPVLKSVPARFLRRGPPRLPVEAVGHAVEPAHVPVDLWDPLNKSTTINTFVRTSRRGSNTYENRTSGPGSRPSQWGAAREAAGRRSSSWAAWSRETADQQNSAPPCRPHTTLTQTHRCNITPTLRRTTCSCPHLF